MSSEMASEDSGRRRAGSAVAHTLGARHTVLGRRPRRPLYSACLKQGRAWQPVCRRGFPCFFLVWGISSPRRLQSRHSAVWEPAGHCTSAGVRGRGAGEVPPAGRTQQISLMGQWLTHWLLHLRGLPWRQKEGGQEKAPLKSTNEDPEQNQLRPR